MFKFILKKSIPIPQMLDYDSYLFIAPHPDDIEVACGGTVAKLVALGKQVTFVIATDGCGGTCIEGLGGQQLVLTRQQESLESASVLGVKRVIFLPFADGGMYDYNDMVVQLQQQIVDSHAEMIVTCDPKVHNEYHADHITVGKATTHAYHNSVWSNLNKAVGIEGVGEAKAIAYYHTDRPNRYVGIQQYKAKKLEAIKCHKSQFSSSMVDMLNKYLTLSTIRHGIRSGKGRAEAYRVVTILSGHCIPELSIK